MLTMTIDLLKNYALVQGSSTWFPGEEAGLHWLSDHGVASAEEMLYLYNELGLALYNTGSVQDALSVWGLAMTWQRVVFFQDEQQGTMYAASLNAHLAMGYLQQGRLDTAKECIERALAAAREMSNDDLILRLQGIEGRLAHFRGDVPRARSTYARVVRGLGKCGNKRAESYFMRLHAALELRFGDKESAERMARESMSIGASQNAPDLVAFASELLGRTYHAQGKTQAAIQEYRIALNQAKELDIAGLQADVLLGLAKIQLDLGDAHAARSRALEAMALANIHLLVVRQIKSLILLGKAAAELGEATLPVAYFKQAERLASDSQFRLAEHDAQEALAELRVGGRDWSH
jgi:tetratricopeptide (TPR) repeat protein